MMKRSKGLPGGGARSVRNPGLGKGKRDRFSRLRHAAKQIPKGDRDREDLLALFDLVERQKEELKQLSGALEISKLYLEFAKKRIDEQQVTINWLRRRIGKRKDLQDYEQAELQALAAEVSYDGRSF
jgi:phage-related minor tail protein